jgi:hypothetical protein
LKITPLGQRWVMRYSCFWWAIDFFWPEPGRGFRRQNSATLCYFGNRPEGMFCDQRIGVGGSGLQCGDIIPGAGISQGDTDVAEEAASLQSFDGRIFEKSAEIVIVQ